MSEEPNHDDRTEVDHADDCPDCGAEADHLGEFPADGAGAFVDTNTADVWRCTDCGEEWTGVSQ